MARRFEYAQAEEIRDIFARHAVRYLFIGKSGAILLGYPGDFETVNQLAGALNDQVVYGLPADDLMRFPEKLAAATLDEVNAAAREYFRPQHAALVVVGDLEKIEDSIRELKLGPIHYLDRDGNAVATGAELSSR